MRQEYSEADNDWNRFQVQAVNAVQAGYRPEHESGYSDTLELQLLQTPAFDSSLGWQIYRRQPVMYRRSPIENEGKPRFLGCRTEWHQAEDAVKFSSPITRLEHLNRLSPTLTFQSFELDSEWIPGVLTKLCRLNIPPFVTSNRIGIDGVNYEVSYGNYMASAQLSWWGDGPDEWRSLIAVILPLLRTLERLTSNDKRSIPSD